MNDNKNLKNVEIPEFIAVMCEGPNRGIKLNPKDQTRTNATKKHLRKRQGFALKISVDVKTSLVDSDLLVKEHQFRFFE
ncbi:MAG: hypothetical protein B7Z60_09250 [Ferrovum sp. 37-45-19]|jgi:hypothetical protein|nr:MAG: hypothetical protein B7Z60_09250 [Ferrovum sp. 37-45-19]